MLDSRETKSNGPTTRTYEPSRMMHERNAGSNAQAGERREAAHPTNHPGLGTMLYQSMA